MSGLFDKARFPKVDQSVYDKYQKLHDEIIKRVLNGTAVALVGGATKCNSCGYVNGRGWVVGCKCGGQVEHGFLIKQGSDSSQFATKEYLDSLTVPLIDSMSGDDLA